MFTKVGLGSTGWSKFLLST